MQPGTTLRQPVASYGIATYLTGSEVISPGGMSLRYARRAAIVTALTAITASTAVPGQCPDGSPPPCTRSATAHVATSPNSIAVLYFDNLSRDSADAYIADGLTDEVIVRLQHVQRLDVKSRN